MAIANVSQRRDSGFAQALRTAQEAIHLPEVQEMLRRLAEYKLGIFMPHIITNIVVNSSSYRMTSSRWNPVWRYLSIHWMNSQTGQIAFSLWDGVGAPVHRCRWPRAKWFAKEQRTMQSATPNIRRINQTNGCFICQTSGAMSTKIRQHTVRSREAPSHATTSSLELANLRR